MEIYVGGKGAQLFKNKSKLLLGYKPRISVCTRAEGASFVANVCYLKINSGEAFLFIPYRFVLFGRTIFHHQNLLPQNPQNMIKKALA